MVGAHVTKGAVTLRVVVAAAWVSALGILVIFPSIHPSPASPFPPPLPGLHVPGSSCVVVGNLVDSTNLATHGDPVTRPTAVAHDDVGVRAELGAKTESATATSSAQLQSVRCTGDVVDAAAEIEGRTVSVAPTTSPLALTIGAGPMRHRGPPPLQCFDDRHGLSPDGVEGSSKSERRPIVTWPRCNPCASWFTCRMFPRIALPRLLLLLVILLPALLVSARAEAAAAAGAPWGRADSLVPKVHAVGGVRRRIGPPAGPSTSKVDGQVPGERRSSAVGIAASAGAREVAAQVLGSVPVSEPWPQRTAPTGSAAPREMSSATLPGPTGQSRGMTRGVKNSAQMARGAVPTRVATTSTTTAKKKPSA